MRTAIAILTSVGLAALAVVFLVAGADERTDSCPTPSPRSVESLFAPCLAAQPDQGLIARQAALQPSFVPAEAPLWQPPLGPAETPSTVGQRSR